MGGMYLSKVTFT